jgi:LuxR family transcriptional regulator, maltose regulon positive regulatory protein
MTVAALTTGRLPIERQILPLKLTPPPLRPGVLLRPDLQALLSAARVQPITLVTAPAGYGKTTMLAQWVQDLSRTGAVVCWLSLDAGDRDVGLFLAYLIRAFQNAVPGVGADAWRSLNSTGNLQRDWPLVAGALCGDLQRQAPHALFLFLDDLHLVVESAVIAQILGYVVRAAPPSLHVVFASRRAPAFAPLGRMRAEGLVLEIGQRDLHLSNDEARQLLASQGITLTDEELGLLLARTDGWPLSVQLAARVLVGQPTERRGAFVRDLSGSQEQLIDYLATEVLADLSDELIDFLRIAAMPSYFDAALLEQVLLRDDTSYLLQRAQELGLPIMPIDNQGGRLRFHTIWRELLLRGVDSMLDHETATALHRRFGHAFEQRGDLPAALDHYAQAGAEEELVRALHNHAWPLLQSPRRDMVRRWLELLPENLRDTNPELLYMWGYSLTVINPERASSTIEHASELFRQSGQFQRELRALSDLAALLFLDAREARFSATALRAVRAANRVRDQWSRGAALVCVTAMLYAKGRELPALQVARHAAALPLNPAWHWLLAMIAATIELRLGRPDDAIARIDGALRIPQIDEDDRLRQNLLRLYAMARFDQGHIAEATGSALNAHRYLGDFHHTGIVGVSAQQIAFMLMLQGRTDESSTYIAQARSAFHDRGALAPLASLQVIELYGSLVRGQAARALGAVPTALRRLQESMALSPDLRLRLMLGVVLGEGGEPWSALVLVREVADRMLERGYRLFLASAELYAAHLAGITGNANERESRLRAGWSMAETDGISYLPHLPTVALCDVAEAALRAAITPATVARVLRRQAPEQASALLQQLLTDTNASVRSRAAALLGDLGSAAAFPALRALTKDRSTEVRQAAESALGRLVYRPPYRLHIRTLGSFGIWRGDQEVRDRDWRSSKARQLFQLLVTERGRALSRDQVIDVLWPEMEPDPASNNLRVTINRLSKALEPDRPEGAPPAYLIQQSETYSLNTESDLEIDAVVFTSAVEEGRQAHQRGQRPAAVAALRRAVGLYGGPYLPDCLYEDWATVERERLALLFSEGAMLLATMLLDDGQIHEAIGLSWRVLDQDRAYEESYRLLMRAHAALGERTSALRLYERCVTVLHDDLGVEPLPETIALHQQIRGAAS